MTREEIKYLLNNSPDDFQRTMDRMECESCPFEEECMEYGGRTPCTIIASRELSKDADSADNTVNTNDTNRKRKVIISYDEPVTLTLTEQQFNLLNWLYENEYLLGEVTITPINNNNEIDLT